MLVPVGLDVVEGLFAVGAVPEGFVPGDADDFGPWCRGAGCVAEEDVDFFQGTASCFGLWEECQLGVLLEPEGRRRRLT